MTNSKDIAKRMQAIREWVRSGCRPDPAHPSPADLSPLTDLNRLRDRVADIQARQVVREQPFVSSLPVLGRLIVWMRSVWNWMSTQWYVIPLVQQQNSFNAFVAQAWAELLRYLDHVVLFARDVYLRVDRLESRLDEMAAGRMALPESPSSLQPLDVAGVIEAAAPGWRDLFAAGPVVVLSCGRGEVVRRLAEQGTQVYGVESDVALAQQSDASDLNIVHASDVEHLASLPEGMLEGVLAVWPAAVSAQTLVRLLDQCRRALRAGAWVVWVWPWPAAVDETHAQLARSIALGMGFSCVRLDAHQRIDVAFQTLSARK